MRRQKLRWRKKRIDFLNGNFTSALANIWWKCSCSLSPNLHSFICLGIGAPYARRLFAQNSVSSSPKCSKVFTSYIIAFDWDKIKVLLNYPPPHFQGDEKPKGGPLEIEIFFVEGVYERGWRGVRSLLKPSSAFLINKKLKFQNVGADN